MPVSLFTGPYEVWTDEALQLEADVGAAVKPIFDDYVGRGVSMREIEYIMQRSAADLAAEALILRAAKKGKET